MRSLASFKWKCRPSSTACQTLKNTTRRHVGHVPPFNLLLCHCAMHFGWYMWLHANFVTNRLPFLDASGAMQMAHMSSPVYLTHVFRIFIFFFFTYTIQYSVGYERIFTRVFSVERINVPCHDRIGLPGLLLPAYPCNARGKIHHRGCPTCP